MDIEQLKLILEAVDGLGNATLDTVIWYLVITEVPNFIMSIIVISGIGYLASRLIRMGETNTDSYQNKVIVKAVRDKLGVGSPGCLTNAERAAILERLEEITLTK